MTTQTTPTPEVTPTSAAPAAPANPAPPVPAPATPEPEAKKGEAAIEAPKWTATGNAVVDGAAEAYLAGGGALTELESIFADTYESGKLSATAKSALEKHLGPAAKALIPTLELQATQHKEWAAAETKKIHDAFGGEAGFKEVAAWGKANLTEAQRKQINLGLDAGGADAEAAINYLKHIMREKGATVQGEQVQAKENGTAGGEFISRAEYITKKSELVSKRDFKAVEALEASARVSLAAAKAAGNRW